MEINPQEDLLTKVVPIDIMINILSRLPIRSIVSCKCVCKALHDVVETRDFVHYHISKSVSGLFVQQSWSRIPCMILECEAIDDGFNVVSRFRFPENLDRILGMCSVNGLLLFRSPNYRDHVILCNPITREYTMIPRHDKSRPEFYGFGVSKKSGKYKIVKISGSCDCQVYTLGTPDHSWRSIEIVGSEALEDNSRCPVYNSRCPVFVNGNIYWLVYDKFSEGVARICVLDLETEAATICPYPPPPPEVRRKHIHTLCSIGDSLCYCDCSNFREVNIWLLKEQVWTKKLCVPWGSFEPVPVLKMFKNGEVLMQHWYPEPELELYTNSTPLGNYGLLGIVHKSFTTATIYTPSFLRLNTLAVQNVTSF